MIQATGQTVTMFFLASLDFVGYQWTLRKVCLPFKLIALVCTVYV
jgi:hypothetical protein